MKFLNKSLFIISLATVSTLSYANTYCNARFGFCVDYPNYLIPQPESDNGDGRRFKLAKSSANISASAGYNVSAYGNITGGQYLKEIQQDYRQNYKISYELLKNNSYTVSGYDNNGFIFYQSTKVKGDKHATVYFNYPVSDKAKMNNVIKQMQSSLRF